MATLSSSKIYSLVERLFTFSRRDSDHATFDIIRVIHPRVRAFADATAPCAESEDRRWLERTELRSPSQVIEVLEQAGFDSRPGSTRALFVDMRCGLIGSHDLKLAEPGFPDKPVTQLLQMASRYHAEGIILATNDPSGEAAERPELRDFTMQVYRKGGAIEVHLLDHFVLTSVGWKRMFAIRQDERH